jgi:hypothetical protein
VLEGTTVTRPVIGHFPEGEDRTQMRGKACKEIFAAARRSVPRHGDRFIGGFGVLCLARARARGIGLGW